MKHPARKRAAGNSESGNRLSWWRLACSGLQSAVSLPRRTNIDTLPPASILLKAMYRMRMIVNNVVSFVASTVVFFNRLVSDLFLFLRRIKATTAESSTLPTKARAKMVVPCPIATILLTKDAAYHAV